MLKIIQSIFFVFFGVTSLFADSLNVVVGDTLKQSVDTVWVLDTLVSDSMISRSDTNESVVGKAKEEAYILRKSPLLTGVWKPVIGSGYVFSKTSWGYFFDEEQIKYTDASTIAELLEYLPGFSVQRNMFWAGAEEININGLKIHGIVITIDQIPFIVNDLNWHNIPKWSPISFKSIKVTQFSKSSGGRFLLIELESKKGCGSMPVADVFWQTGSFDSNMLDVFFSKNLSKSVSFFIHSRNFQTKSDNYTHPDVITTFYESIGKDTSNIMKSGYNPMQSAQNFRLGLQKKFKNGIDVYCSYLALTELDSLFTIKDDTASIFQTRQELFGRKLVKTKYTSSIFGIENIGLFNAKWSASFNNTSKLGKDIKLKSVFGNKMGRYELGVNKKIESDKGKYSSPINLWGAFSIKLGMLTYNSLYAVTKPANYDVYTYSYRNRLRLEYKMFFTESDVFYGTLLPLKNMTFNGIPVEIISPSVDTVFTHSHTVGVRMGGYCVNAKYGQIYQNQPYVFAMGENYLPVSDMFYSLGIYTYKNMPLEFGSSFMFTNGYMKFKQHTWMLLKRMAVHKRLKYESYVSADYVSAQKLPDLKNNVWIKVNPFWDISLKFTIQIKDFRLFYKINNLFDSRIKYYEPYPVPGLNFLYGVRWTLKG